jgi:hypothetical protein
MVAKRKNDDAFGALMLAQLSSRGTLSEIIEREDGFIATGSHPGLYFSEFKAWIPPEKRAIKFARGRVLDIGCGAGRHAIYLRGTGPRCDRHR